jgi:hypothetical protein
MRGDHLDAIALGQIPIQAVTVTGFVAVIIDESDDFRPLAAFGGSDRKAPFGPREGGINKGPSYATK